MVIEKEVVFCQVCYIQHDKHPEEREDTWNGKTFTGVWAKDYTYHNDFFRGQYGPICNEGHDRDQISERKLADIYEEYDEEKEDKKLG